MTIAEVSKKFGLTADTLRYYERIGLIPPVRRSSSGIRDYDEKDCNWVEFIKCMRGAGLPVEMLIEYVALFGQGHDTIAARKALLVEQRQQLAEKIVTMHISMAGIFRTLREDIRRKQTCRGTTSALYWST